MALNNYNVKHPNRTTNSKIKRRRQRGTSNLLCSVQSTSFPGSLILLPPGASSLLGAVRWETLGTRLAPSNMKQKQRLAASECIWKITYLNLAYRYEVIIDYRSYTHNLSSCEIIAWKNWFRLERDWNPWPTCSINWAIMQSGSWSPCEFVIYL